MYCRRKSCYINGIKNILEHSYKKKKSYQIEDDHLKLYTAKTIKNNTPNREKEIYFGEVSPICLPKRNSLLYKMNNISQDKSLKPENTKDYKKLKTKMEQDNGRERHPQFLRLHGSGHRGRKGESLTRTSQPSVRGRRHHLGGWRRDIA